MRTTSSIEAMNSVIQRSFPSNTHIFKFVESLRLHESIKSSNLYQLSLGDISNQQLLRRRALDRERDEKIKIFSEKLKDGVISTAEFLKSMTESNEYLTGI